MKIVALIQARSGSKRLPGKVLKELMPGKSILSVMLTRLKQSNLISQIVVATSNGKNDDKVESEVLSNGVDCFRGDCDENDVLTRFFQAAKKFEAEVVVRLCADSPLHDSQIVDSCVDEYIKRQHEIDFVTNCLPETFPYGTAVEVLPYDVLSRLNRLSTQLEQREHVTQFIYQNQELFRYHCVQNKIDYSKERWVVDTPEDFEFVKSIYQKLGPEKITTDWLQIIDLIKSN